MEKSFYQGQKLLSVMGTWCEAEQTCTYYKVEHNCINIEVVMENGQMSGIPWAFVEFNDKPPTKVNLALMEVVELL